MKILSKLVLVSVTTLSLSSSVMASGDGPSNTLKHDTWSLECVNEKERTNFSMSGSKPTEIDTQVAFKGKSMLDLGADIEWVSTKTVIELPSTICERKDALEATFKITLKDGTSEESLFSCLSSHSFYRINCNK